jgi:tetratricopeptide (TPR) repeat protein
VSRRTAYVLVVLVAVAIPAQTVLFPLLFDDQYLIVENSFLHEPWSAVRAFAHSFWHGTPMLEGYYRPIVVASFALNGGALGWSAWGFHLVNVLLHAANAALVLGLLLRVAVPMRGALFGALLFAAHPAVAWPVGSVVARVDLLPALFVLLAFHALAAGRPIATGAAFLAALLSKESAAAFAVIPFLAMRTPLIQPAPPRRRLAACGAACLAALAGGIGARLAAGTAIGLPRALINPIVNPMAAMADADRVRAALRLAGRYLLYLVVPARFSDAAGYGAGAAGPGWGSPGVLVGTALLVLFAGAAIVLWWRRDRIALDLAFALGAFLPASNLFFPISSLYAQNFLYLPLLGLALAAGDLAGRAEARGLAPGARAPGVRRGTFAAGAVVAVLAAATVFELRVWSSPAALFTAWTDRFPRYPLAWSRLGVALLDAGDLAGSEAASRRALDLHEQNAEAHYNLGVALLLGSADPSAPDAAGAPGAEAAAARVADAVDHVRRAAALQPDLVQAHVNAAKGLLLLNRPAEAETEARAALALDESLVPARMNLAESLFRQERYADALGEFRVLARAFPQDPNVRSPFVVSLLHAGAPEETRREAEAARRDFPDLAWFDFCLARVEARAGHAAEARDLLRRAREREPHVDEWIARVHDFDRLPKE